MLLCRITQGIIFSTIILFPLLSLFILTYIPRNPINTSSLMIRWSMTFNLSSHLSLITQMPLLYSNRTHLLNHFITIVLLLITLIMIRIYIHLIILLLCNNIIIIQLLLIQIIVSLLYLKQSMIFAIKLIIFIIIAKHSMVIIKFTTYLFILYFG